MDERILKRLDRAAGVDDIAGALERLAPTDLQSLLLEVYRRRAGVLTPKALLRRYEENRFVSPAASNPSELLEFDRQALALVPDDYQPIELSPVAPLGAASVLGKLSQDWAIATSRNSEVVSDSTNVLALECALRRRRDRKTPVKLISSHRLVRGQDYGAFGRQHFRILGLAAGGRGDLFEVEAVVEQLSFFARLLGDVRIVLIPLACTLAEDVLERMDGQVELDHSRSSGGGYYVRLRFKIYGGDIELGDGGFTEWTQTLLGDTKERLLISGIGTERAVTYLQPPDDQNEA
jgi:hypothetical protein